MNPHIAATFLSLAALCVAPASRADDHAVATQAAIIESARAALLERLAPRFENIELRVAGNPRGDVCAKAAARVLDSDLAGAELAVRMAVRTRVQCGDAGRIHTATTWFAVAALANVPVAHRDLSRDEVLRADDVRWEKRDAARIGAVTDEAQLRKPVRARVPIAAGAPLLASQIEAVPGVLAGSTVDAIYREQGMQLEFMAIAQADASEGGEVRIERAGASAPLRARVLAPGKVEVLP